LIQLPDGVAEAIDDGWQRSQKAYGFLSENEARFLGTLAACSPAKGNIVEIGSFQGRSTVMLGTVAARFGFDSVVAIDPHEGLGYISPDIPCQSPTFDEFLANLKSAGLENFVEPRRTHSREVGKTWNRPIRLLWIDGDHTYKGCKEDFDLFFPHLAEGGIVAFHDSLNTFEGPIRVFVEEILRSDRFGPSGFVQSIAWSQYRPRDGADFRKQRQELERRARRLLPYVAQDATPKGLRKIAYKLARSRVPRKPISTMEFASLIAQ